MLYCSIIHVNQLNQDRLTKHFNLLIIRLILLLSQKSMMDFHIKREISTLNLSGSEIYKLRHVTQKKTMTKH